MLKIASTQYVELYFDEKDFIYSWKFLPASVHLTTEKVEETIKLMTSTMRNFLPRFVLGNDFENFAVFAHEIQDWIAETTIDALLFSKTEKFAVVMPKVSSNYQSIEQTVLKAQKIAREVHVDMFSSLSEAEEWLKSD